MQNSPKPTAGSAKRPVSGAPEKRAGRRRDRDVPAELAKLPFEVRRLMRDLHDPVGRPVRGAPLDDGRCRALDELVRRAVTVIGEEHAPPRREGRGYELPEGTEPPSRHMRQPEPHEDDVIAAVRLQVNRSASTNLTGAPPGTRLAAIASISGDASTAVKLAGVRSHFSGPGPGPP